MNFPEFLHDVLPVIQKFAPAIGGIIGGPVGAATGYALPMLAATFDSNPSDLRGLAEKIANAPDAQKRLSKIETNHLNMIDFLQDHDKNMTNFEMSIKISWDKPTDKV